MKTIFNFFRDAILLIAGFFAAASVAMAIGGGLAAIAEMVRRMW